MVFLGAMVPPYRGYSVVYKGRIHSNPTLYLITLRAVKSVFFTAYSMDIPYAQKNIKALYQHKFRSQGLLFPSTKGISVIVFPKYHLPPSINPSKTRAFW